MSDVAEPEEPSNLAELTAARSPNPAWRITLISPEVGGGRLSTANLDEIARHPGATALQVSGLDQATFETLVRRYGQQFTALHLWKCPRIQDLSPLEDLPGLTLVSIYWNQRASKLWHLARTPRLRGLQFEDFTRLKHLGDLSNAVSIEELNFGDKVWLKATVDSLEPVGEVTTLRRLSMGLRKVEDGRIQPLARLKLLEQLDCPSNLFTTEQLTWLRAHLPDRAQGRVLEPVQRLDKPIPNPNSDGPDRDVLVMGKRKPFLSSQVDGDRVQRYIDDYWQMVSRFREDLSVLPRGG